MNYSHSLCQWAYDRYNFKVITPPTEEHVTLEEAQQHLRIIPFGSPPESDEDAWLTRNISVAREWCESFSLVALSIQTLELGVSRFPGTWPYFNGPGYLPHVLLVDNGIILPMAASGSFIRVESVKYDDASGTPQTLDPSAYYVDDYAKQAVLYPTASTSWPTAQDQKRAAVRVRYICGFDVQGQSPTNNPIPLPFQFKAAMLLVLGHLHENRENSAEIDLKEIPLGAASLMARYSVDLGMA